MALIPIVVERNGREERAMDIYSRLLQDRIIILGTAIDDNVANVAAARDVGMTALWFETPDKLACDLRALGLPV